MKTGTPSPGGPPPTSLSTATCAFQDALELLCNQQPAGGHLEAWLKDKYTQADVEKSIEEAKCLYEARSNSKARTWLGKLSSGILSYGKVMDMLAQHHPEYVSLAWGTTKLLFILFQHHDELVTELAKSMAEISDMLPRTNQYLAIYNSPVLLKKAETLFGLIIQHFHAMIKFYREGRLKHAWKAFIHPYSLRFKALKDEIDQCSRSIDLCALASLHVNVHAIGKDQIGLNDKVDLIDEKLSLLMSRILQIQNDTALLPSMSISQNRLEMSDMMAMTSASQLSPPTEVLRHRLSFSRRNMARYKIGLKTIWSAPALRAWSTSPNSRAIMVQGSWFSRNETNAMGTHMTEFVRQSDCTCLWALQHMTESKKTKGTWTQVLKYLAMQALQRNSDAISKSLNNDFNSLVVASAVSDQQWEAILLRALSGSGAAYLVIDLAVLEALELTELEAILQSVVRLTSASSNEPGSSTVKIAILGSARMNTASLTGFHRLEMDRFLRRGRNVGQGRHTNAAKGRVPLKFHVSKT
ncbi:hypothetical protein M409DRAFT_52660 [Zasmidium cellare ATCC 36951]|uniref:DUF7708 domain-containing protein n=1 Tax=Zasmidium cellare ATCC 36951 TaxID=1080233 RepID=A0A6A6CTB2_ZASCE|nr:uncharacterized protein M409DRAFT_52660 [Zasmidium cellare ATCC 36951]KAF2169418.1 hypothetical protein M409DRAFT_52660 [Zasmidium cellare ATCC 36951]